MDVQDIVWAHLQKIGATGLCNGDCGCKFPDLMPCDDCTRNCIPAIEKKCGEDCPDCGGDGGCMIPFEDPTDKTANAEISGQKAAKGSHGNA